MMRLASLFTLITLSLAPALAAQCCKAGKKAAKTTTTTSTQKQCCKAGPKSLAKPPAPQTGAQTKVATAGKLLYNDACPVTGLPTSANTPVVAFGDARISLCCNACKPVFAKMAKKAKSAFVAKFSGKNRRTAFPVASAAKTAGGACANCPGAKAKACAEGCGDATAGKKGKVAAAKSECCQDKAAAAAKTKDCGQECAGTKKATAAKSDCCKDKATAAAKTKDCGHECAGTKKATAAKSDCCKGKAAAAAKTKDCGQECAGTKKATAAKSECCKDKTTTAAKKAKR